MTVTITTNINTNINTHTHTSSTTTTTTTTTAGRVYALKCMHKDGIVRNKQETNVLLERNMLFLCRESSFITNIYQTFNLPNEIMMLMEFVQGV